MCDEATSSFCINFCILQKQFAIAYNHSLTLENAKKPKPNQKNRLTAVNFYSQLSQRDYLIFF